MATKAGEDAAEERFSRTASVKGRISSPEVSPDKDAGSRAPAARATVAEIPRFGRQRVGFSSKGNPLFGGRRHRRRDKDESSSHSSGDQLLRQSELMHRSSSSRKSNSTSSSSSASAGTSLLNTGGQGGVVRRKSRGLAGSRSSSNGGIKGLLGSGWHARGTNTQGPPLNFGTVDYEYEWHEPSFFNKPSDNKPDDPSPTAPLLGRGRASPPAESSTPVHSVSVPHPYAVSMTQAPASPEVPSLPRESVQTFVQPLAPKATVLEREGEEGGQHQVLNVWPLNRRLEKYMLIEVAAGQRQMVELTAAEIIRRVRIHRYTGNSEIKRRPLSSRDAGLDGASKNKPQSVGELTYRDIRQIFSPSTQMVNPSIEVRRNCILLCIPPLTGLIFHDRCVFLVNDELDTDSQLLKLEDITGTYSNRADVIEEYWNSYGQTEPEMLLLPPPTNLPTIKSSPNMEIRKSRSKMLFGGDEDTSEGADGTFVQKQVPRYVSFPLEFAMLEICVSAALEYLHQEIAELESILQKANKKLLKRNPNVQRLEDLHGLKAPVQVCADRVESLSQEFKDLLSSSEDMNNMELTKLFYRPEFYNDDVNTNAQTNPHLEILLEFFDQEIDQFGNRCKALLRTIDNAERLITLRLGVTRNKLVYYELAGTLITVGLSFGTCVSGVFGMNLANGYEDSNFAFWLMTSLVIFFATAGIVFVTLMIIRFKV
eukprot:Blabericola_migrator_1__2384@NODE_166_length_12211_cov_61_370142_g144_i0_p3_GENE_NODE_166_length_12211_cov_61_370142_g144_i0NODE_166_length_12211_cov_61_370142_g144_i0_p3_ORF_typecomplete_len709_score116_72CorA/PF01544_18/9_4e11Helo_like_N/PF17111_5/0_0034DUF1843/PF08898_10/31DUF1843/PF08898_10/6_8FH2/PF02181_23/0_069DUF5536/PF17688_1/0_29SesA/PF17107_5/0_39_NODE_166_length_12211_cov_61_370142_g144_i0332159